MKKRVLMFIFGLAVNVYSQNKPIEIALFSPLQIFSEEVSITGVRLNILYGNNSSITGLWILGWSTVHRKKCPMAFSLEFWESPTGGSPAGNIIW